MRRLLRRADVDAVFYPTVYTWFPPPRAVPSLVCVHDTIPERFPQYCFANGRARRFWSLKVKWAVSRAGLVLTVSKKAAADIERILGVPRERLRVTSEAPSPVFHPASDADMAGVLKRLGIAEAPPYFLYVGGLNPHKRLDLLLRALADTTGRLVVVGGEGDVFHEESSRLKALAAQLGIEARVMWLGRIDDDDLRTVYTAARALVLPSMCEGFGLPAVEAAACGTPAVVTEESPLPEILAGAGLFIPPGDQAALTTALARLSKDDALRETLAGQAVRRVSDLSWRRTAEDVLAAVEEVS